MDDIKFIEAIKLGVQEASIKSMIENLNKPPGRKPSVDLLELSQWYNQLNESDKSFVYKAISKSVFTSIFGFLCVLDGVRAIEKILLNDFDSEFLHEIFNSAE